MNTVALQNSLDIFTRNHLQPDTHFRYEIAQRKHKKGIIKIFTKAFCENEPMTQYLHIDPKKFKAFSKQVTENAIRDHLSIVALDKDKVVACALIEDFADMHEAPTDFDPKFKYITSLLETLGGNFFKDKKFEKNTIAHLAITAVDKDYRRKGLSTQVNFHAMDLAVKRGFRFMYSELTNFYNEMGVFNHMKENHRRLIGACDYKDFEIDGIKPFSDLKGYAHGYLWELTEGAVLQYCVDNKIISETI
jgi:hypothetical protein